MKNLFFIAGISSVILLFSCEKADTNENKCPVVSAGAVPQIVKDSFNVRYPATNVITWFNKDNTGFSAFFKSSGIEKLTQFSSNGNFVKEENEENDHDDHEGNPASGGKGTAGCECDTEDH